MLAKAVDHQTSVEYFETSSTADIPGDGAVPRPGGRVRNSAAWSTIAKAALVIAGAPGAMSEKTEPHASEDNLSLYLGWTLAIAMMILCSWLGRTTATQKRINTRSVGTIASSPCPIATAQEPQQ